MSTSGKSYRFFILFICNVILVCGYSQKNKAINPIIHADVPDNVMIRVGKNYYMSSTTMHMNPGLPIMKSTDLVNWKLINYAYQILGDQPELTLTNGKSDYGRGSWASSLRYHKGVYYVTTFSSTTGKTYIFRTNDIEKGNWQMNSFSPSIHDHTLFFDENDKAYLIHGVSKIRMVELNDDLTGLREGNTEKVIIENASAPAGDNIMLGAEGSQLFKVNGKYYLFHITWPRGGMRTTLIHRADNILGPWEGRVALQDLGVAQGGLIETPDGRWFAYLFRDYGGVGRIPYLVPVKWENGWPVLGENGKVPMTLDLPKNKSLIPNIVASDEFKRKKGQPNLPLVWQWNHNPVNSLWSISERPGFLRFKTDRIDTSFVMARNTLTQRTFGPYSSASTSVDLSAMKEGDYVGLCLLQKNYGLVGIKVENGSKKIFMVRSDSGKPMEVGSIPLTTDKIFLKADCNFLERADLGQFYYSLNGKTWIKIGEQIKMPYTLPHFMGYRFGLFYYSTKESGGYADFDWFRVKDKL
jgi:beta-xylosidase